MASVNSSVSSLPTTGFSHQHAEQIICPCSQGLVGDGPWYLAARLDGQTEKAGCCQEMESLVCGSDLVSSSQLPPSHWGLKLVWAGPGTNPLNCKLNLSCNSQAVFDGKMGLFFPLLLQELKLEVAVEMPVLWWFTGVTCALDFMFNGAIAQGTLSNSCLPLGGLNSKVL